MTQFKKKRTHIQFHILLQINIGHGL